MVEIDFTVDPAVVKIQDVFFLGVEQIREPKPQQVAFQAYERKNQMRK